MLLKTYVQMKHRTLVVKIEEILKIDKLLQRTRREPEDENVPSSQRHRDYGALEGTWRGGKLRLKNHKTPVLFN